VFAKMSDSFAARLLLALALYCALVGAWMHTPPASDSPCAVSAGRGR